jgi:two-component system, NtrC family, sensor kinase
VLAMLAIFAVIPIALGAPPFQVAAAVCVGALIHWFSEGRALVLRTAVADVKVAADKLRGTNAELEAQKQELERINQQLRSTRDQLIQSEKLAAIGQLAAGVAHEINNPLSVILGFAQGLDRRVESSSTMHLPVSSIVRESLRCRDLVQELLTFSRTSTKTTDRIDVNSLLRGTAQLLESRARTQATSLVLDLADQPPVLVANKTHLQQIVINLGNNALDAVSNGGTLVLRSRCADDEVYIEVEDSGPGIPEHIRRRIFEPFFTTKDVGKGTGLGLSLAYEMARQQGGAIEVESESGRGTTMTVRLPVTQHGAPS